MREGEGSWLYAAYYGVNVSMVLALGCASRYVRRRLSSAWLLVLLLFAVLSLGINGVFLVEVAAPRLLRLPYHHCPYDLVPRAPESLVAVALFLVGSFSVGWACVAAWLGNHPEARPFLSGMVGRLLYLGCIGYLGSVMMMSTELALA